MWAYFGDFNLKSEVFQPKYYNVISKLLLCDILTNGTYISAMCNLHVYCNIQNDKQQANKLGNIYVRTFV